MKTSILTIIMFVCLAGPLVGEDGDSTYTNPTIGISITKPAEWHFVTAEQHQENLERVNMKDEQFRQYVLEHSRLPLVAMTKYPEPHDDLNPSLKINVRPLGSLPKEEPVKILEAILPQLRRSFEGFSIEEGPRDTVLAGARTAYARFHYSLETQDSTVFPTCSEIWIIPRTNHLLMIGAGTRQDEKNGKREEIAEILATLKIDKE